MDLNRHFSEENIKMIHNHMKRYSMLLAMREMHSKTTMKQHFIPTRMAKIKKADTECWQGCEKSGPTLKRCWYKCEMV